MGKIDLKGLKGLKGSALAGLKGMYTPEGYTSYIEANQSAISKKKMQNPWKNDIDIADNMYVTKLIKDDIGEDEYDKQGIWSMSVAEKVDYYNNRYSQTKNPLDAAEVAMTTPVQKDSTANTLAYDGSISMKEYNEKINNEISLLPDDYPIFLLDPKEDNTRVTMSDILKRKSETQENGEQYTFKKKGRSELGPTTKQAEYERSSYAKEYRKAMDSSYQTASDMYENFYKEITETDSDSAKFLKHADFYNLPLTVDGIKDIMADYYATKDLYGPEIAQQSTLTALQNYASESQGWFSGANSRFGNIAPGFTSAIISSFVNIGSFLINGPAAIALAASGDEPLEETKDIISKHEFYQKLANDPGAYENFKKMSFKDRLDFLMGNSELSRNANAIAKTGELNKEKRQYMIEEGLSNIENIRKPGEETEIWNWNTLFDLLPQAGYTVAAMYTGGGIAKGLTWISKLAGLRRASKALQAANKLKLAKAAMSIDDIVIMGLSAVPSAAAEATMDAQDVYDEIMEGSYAEMSSMLNKKFEAEIDDRNSDLWKYIEEEMSKQPIPLSTEGQHLTDEDYAKIQREKVQSLMEKYYNDNYQSLLDSPEFNREVTGAAMRASANTMGAETMYIAAGTLLLQNTLGRGVKALKGDLVRRINPAASGRFALTTENGTIRVGVRGSANSKARAVAKGISQGITESAEEGFEELYQGVTSDVNTGLAYDYLERYLNARYNGESTEELATSLWQNLDVAQKLIGESMFSEENVFAFAMGAMGAALGSPTALRGGVQLARMSKEERKSLSKKEIANMLWRNPFSENIHDNLNEIQHLQTEAEYYNKLIENQTIDVKALGDVNGIISWINEEAKALMNNDEVGARDARASQTMQTLLLMDKLKGTAYANAFKRELEAMSKMDVNNLNEGSKTILDKARTIRQDTTSQDAEILQDIKDRAKKTLNMMEQIDYWSANIEGEFGNAIDPEVKNGIITNHVMMSEWERRVDDINKYVAEQINRGKKVPLSFEGASDTQNTSAKHGSIEHIKDQIAKIDKTIELLERSTPKKERGAIYKSRIRQLQALKKELQSDSKLLTENSSTLIKAEDILSLDPEARAALLDEKNLNNYSQEQQDEIAKFKKDPNVTSEILKDIQDASTIQKK